MDYLIIGKTVLVLASISGVLALIMSIANNTIANYGTQTVIINNEKELSVDGGDSLLYGLIENEVFLPSACGGKGSCGYCKCQVLEGGGELLPTEMGFITEEEAKDHYRLACQLKVKEPLKIAVPEEYLSLRQYDAKVSKLVDLTDRIKHVFIDLPEGESITFKPGQYVQILAPEYAESDEEVYRAYSLASAPSQTNEIELFIGYVPEGVATTYVHHYLKPNDNIQVIGPFGHFFYQTESERDMIMVAIGTGMAPIMGILRYMQEHKITNRKVTFFYSARTPKDFFLMEKLNEIKRDLPLVEYVFSVTNASEEDNWDGPTGLVTEEIKNAYSDLSEAEAYLCGSPPMINATVEVLKDLQMPEERIFYDKFE